MHIDIEEEVGHDAEFCPKLQKLSVGVRAGHGAESLLECVEVVHATSVARLPQDRKACCCAAWTHTDRTGIPAHPRVFYYIAETPIITSDVV